MTLGVNCFPRSTHGHLLRFVPPPGALDEAISNSLDPKDTPAVPFSPGESSPGESSPGESKTHPGASLVVL